MVLTAQKKPLELREVKLPVPKEGQILIKVDACAVCRTDLHIVDGDLKEPKLPLIPGHQIVGRVIEDGKRFLAGERVGVPWLAKACGSCSYCLEGKENLCDSGLYMGYNLDGGFAEYCTAYEDYVFKIDESYSSIHAAPLLCAGLIGYRTLSFAPDAKKIGFYGFGAAAHILCQVATFQGKEVYAFSRPGDCETQDFAKKLGAVWAGGSDELPPVLLDAALIFAPVGALIPKALAAVKKGGSVISAGIHMSDIPPFSYSLLYGERVIRSVTNLTRRDGEEFFCLVAKKQVNTAITTYPLEEANQALDDLRSGKLVGSAVLALTF